MVDTVGDQGVLHPQTLEAVPNHGRDPKQEIRVWTPEFVVFPKGTRTAVVEKHEPDPSHRHGEMLHGPVMPLPSLDRPRPNQGKIDLTEPIELRPIRTQHVHDRSPRILDDPEPAQNDTADAANGFEAQSPTQGKPRPAALAA